MVTASRSTFADPVAERAEDFVRAFREHGFVHVPRLFSEQEVAQFKAAAVDAESPEGPGNLAEADFLGTRQACAKGACGGRESGNDTLRSPALHPRLGALAERLAGMPLRVWASEVLVKQPNDIPTGLHDDLTAEVLNARISLNAWVALVDVPVESGCLTFLPGSHRREEPERVDVNEMNMLDHLARDNARSYLFTHWPEMRWAPRITVPLRAGDVTFHHRRTAHASGANQTRDDRIAVVVTFTDADATYQPLPGHDPLPYKPGQPLPGERFPRVGRSDQAGAPV